jgi:hypothetical protein
VAHDDERPFTHLGEMEIDAVRLHCAMRHSANALRVDRTGLTDGAGRRRADSGNEIASSHR